MARSKTAIATNKATEKRRRMGARVNELRRIGAGTIRPDEMYTMEEVSVRLEQGLQTIREAFNNGLKSFFFGKRKYVRGSDLIDFLQKYESIPGSKNPPPKSRG